MTLTYPIVGIDIGKDVIDGCSLDHTGSKEAFTGKTDRLALARLAKRLKRKGVGLVVLEATGGYERPIMAALAAEEVPFARVNPRAVRDFAKGMNILAKTDRIDAYVLALFGERVRPNLSVLPNQNERQLSDLMLRRRQLIEARKKEKPGSIRPATLASPIASDA
jgi:transposase